MKIECKMKNAKGKMQNYKTKRPLFMGTGARPEHGGLLRKYERPISNTEGGYF
jgi:hypothetical protein